MRFESSLRLIHAARERVEAQSLLHWLTARLPEAGRFADSSVRKKAVLNAVRYVFPRYFAAATPVVPLIMYGTWRLAKLMQQAFPVFGQPIWFGVLAALVAPGVVILLWLCLRGRARLFLRHALLAMGEPICIRCGYDMTDNTTGRCPECGRYVEIRHVPKTTE